MIRSRWVASLLALALVAAACESTNRRAHEVGLSADGAVERRARPGEPGDDAAPAGRAPEVAEDGLGDLGASGGGVPSATGPATGGQPEGAGAGTPPAVARQGPPSEASARGVSATEIVVGVMVPANAGSAAGSFGFKGFSTGDNERQALAVIDHINSTGGILGRRVRPAVFHNDLNQGTYAAQAQAMCTSWTQDHKVFAAVGTGFDLPTLAACMASRGTPLVATPNVSGMGFLDDTQVAEFHDYLYWPNMLPPSSWGLLVDRLVASGFWGPRNRIGLVRFDRAHFARISDAFVKPALARHGMSLTEEVAVAENGSLSEAGGTSAEISAAVLSFKAKGVDRVMFLAKTGGIGVIFMPAAESQGYRPRYALTSVDMPDFLAANVPAEQLSGAAGIGWQPTFDVNFANEPGTTAARDACAQIMRRAGESFPDRSAQNYAYSYCEGLFFLKASLERSGALTVAGLRAGAEALGTGYPPVLTFANRFGPGRHLGVSAVRDLAFDTGCECFAYSGGVAEVPG